MHNRNLLIALSLVLAAVAGNIMLRDAMPDVVLGAPDIEYKKNISPIADSEYELGTSSQAWLRATADELCLTADSCITAWSAGASEHVDAGDYVYPGDGDYHSAPYYVGTSTTATSTFVNASTTKFCIAGDCITDITGTNLSITGGTLNASGGGGSGSVGTSSVPTIGHVPYWTTSGDTPELLGSIATGTLTETVTGLELSATRNLIGGASILSLTAGYDIPLSASTTEWAAAYLWGDHSTAGYVLQSYGSTTYALAADWTSIDNYPTGCTNQAVTAIGDTLTCNTMTDAYVADDITASNYLALSAWYATNTDALAQGSVNLYNQTHTGDVTGATALAIANDKVNYNHIVNTATLAANPAFGASECWFGTTGLICEGSSADTNEALFTVTNPTADRTYTFPDSSITVAGLTSAMTGTFDGNNFGGGAIGAGDILYGSAAGVISELAGAAIHNVLKSAGATVSPVWGKIVAYNLSTTSAFADDDIVTFDSASGGFTGLTCAEITGSADLCDSGDANTTYTAAGTLLDLTGTEFSINEGTLTDGKICTYASGTGIVCNYTDITGGGGSGLWATTTDSLAIYPADTTDVVVIGGNATSTQGEGWAGEILDVQGTARIDDTLYLGGWERDDISGLASLVGMFTASSTGRAGIEMMNKGSGNAPEFRFTLADPDPEGGGLDYMSFGMTNSKAVTPGNLWGRSKDTLGYLFTYGTAHQRDIVIGAAGSVDADLLLIAGGTDAGDIRQFIDGGTGFIGIATTTPSALLTVGSSTPSSAYSPYNSLYVSGDLELDGTIYDATYQGSPITEPYLDINTEPTANYVLYWNGSKLDYTATTSWDTDTTYTAAGTLLDLTGTEFSINEGTLTDGKLCTYSSGTGIVCNSDDQTGGGFATSSADYWTQNDLILTEISDVDGSPTLGDLLSWDGDSWANIATNTLNIAWGDLVGTPTDWTGTLDGIEGAAFLTEAEYIASTSNPYITSASNLTTIGTIISGIWNGTVIDHERGGLEADVSAYSGLVAIAGGATAEVDAKSELEAQIADVSDFAEADGDTYSGTHEFTGATVKQQHYPSISFPAGLATTTTATTTLLIGTAGVGHTFNWADCYVTSGTGGIIISDGTNDSNYIAASTTAAQIAFSTNNTFTQGETRQVQVGPLTAAKIACTFNYEDD